jgi:hypothetical protein
VFNEDTGVEAEQGKCASVGLLKNTAIGKMQEKPGLALLFCAENTTID